MNKHEEDQQAEGFKQFHHTEPPPRLTTFHNQNARAKVRLELDNGILLEVPVAVIMRALHEQWAPSMMRTGRHCMAIPAQPGNLDEEHDRLFLTLSTTPPEGTPHGK